MQGYKTFVSHDGIDEEQELFCCVPYQMEDKTVIKLHGIAVDLFVYEKLKQPLKGIAASEPIIIGKYLLETLWLEMKYNKQTKHQRLGLFREKKVLEKWSMTPLEKLLHLQN